MYQNILLAVDLHPSCDERIVQCAVEFAKTYNAKLTIVHAVEHLNAYGAAQAYPIIFEAEKQLIEEAKNALLDLGRKHGIPHIQQIIETGVPKSVILEQVKKLNPDLIVLGSHGRHGIRLLLGSTTDGVIHHVECDVFVVRVRGNS